MGTGKLRNGSPVRRGDLESRGLPLDSYARAREVAHEAAIGTERRSDPGTRYPASRQGDY